MRLNRIALAPSLLIAAVVSLPAAGAAPSGNPAAQVDFPQAGRLRMELCSSGVEIRGIPENKVRVSYDAPGDAGAVQVRLEASGGDGTLRVEGCPQHDFRIAIEVPRRADLHVRMWAGQIEVVGITGSKDLELHAGELDVDIGKAEDYSHVDASVMTGEVDAAPFHVSKGGLFRSFEREGSGKYRLHAHVGAGQVVFN
jgi:hypothetical protein